MVLVRERHVCRDRGKPTLAGAAGMAGDTLPFAQDLDRGRRQAYVDLLAYQTMRDTVEVAGHFDVIIEMDAGFAPLGILVGLRGQGAEGGLIRRQELRVAGAGEFFERAVIEVSEQG